MKYEQISIDFIQPAIKYKRYCLKLLTNLSDIQFQIVISNFYNKLKKKKS